MGSVDRIGWKERESSRDDKSDGKSRGSTAALHSKLLVLSTGKVIGNPSVEVQ